MKKSLFSILFMFLLTLVCTGAVSAVKVFSDERIARNQEIKLQKVVLKVLGIPMPPDAVDEDAVRLFHQRVQPVEVENQTFYLGRQAPGTAVQGIAFPVGGPGFWGPIYGLVAVTPEADRIIGLAFFKHSETPGLGARMTEPWFTDQFKGLKLRPLPDDQNYFQLKPEGFEHAPGELDAITGASRTSAAVESFLNKGLHRFLNNPWSPLK
ncbi:MAG: FMN-binding protein [Pseudomonadota bacterium]